MFLFQVGMELLTGYIHYNPAVRLTTHFKTQNFNTSNKASIPEFELLFTVADGKYIYIYV